MDKKQLFVCVTVQKNKRSSGCMLFMINLYAGNFRVPAEIKKNQSNLKKKKS